jgi:hypothetical protein
MHPTSKLASKNSCAPFYKHFLPYSPDRLFYHKHTKKLYHFRLMRQASGYNFLNIIIRLLKSFIIIQLFLFYQT